MAPGFVTALPVRSALAVAGRPVCDPRTVARLPKPPISAIARRTVPRFGTGVAHSTGRRRTGVARALDRPRPWVKRRTDRSPRRGPVCSTGHKLRGEVQCGTGLLSRGGLLCTTGLRPPALGIGGTVLDCRSNQYRSPGRTGRIRVPAMDTWARVVSASQPWIAAAGRRPPLPRLGELSEGAGHR